MFLILFTHSCTYNVKSFNTFIHHTFFVHMAKATDTTETVIISNKNPKKRAVTPMSAPVILQGSKIFLASLYIAMQSVLTQYMATQTREQ